MKLRRGGLLAVQAGPLQTILPGIHLHQRKQQKRYYGEYAGFKSRNVVPQIGLLLLEQAFYHSAWDSPTTSKHQIPVDICFQK